MRIYIHSKKENPIHKGEIENLLTLRLVANIAICICTGTGFFHGLVRCFGKQSPLFLKAIIGAMGCMMSGRLFSVVLQLCGGKDVARMNLGYLGVAGCFLFLYSANHGEIRVHIAGIRKRTASALGLLAPIPIIFLIYMIFTSKTSLQYKVLGLFIAIIVLFNAMYLFMYLILPDIGDGFLKMLRPYSLMALIFSYSQLGEIYFSIIGNKTMLIVTYAFLCTFGLFIVPILERRFSAFEERTVQ